MRLSIYAGVSTTVDPNAPNAVNTDTIPAAQPVV
jgi:hypothetical protein